MNDQALCTTNDLVNWSFAHLITPAKAPAKAPTKSPLSEQDPFTYITTDQYTNKEFYRIMINIGALRRLTVGYGQYMTYKRITKGANIDTTQASTINV